MATKRAKRTKPKKLEESVKPADSADQGVVGGNRPGRVFPALLVFYGAALLLNAEGLLRTAGRLPYGPMRDRCVALAMPVAHFSHQIGISRLRSAIESLVNKSK